jgi:hypothetical protein
MKENWSMCTLCNSTFLFCHFSTGKMQHKFSNMRVVLREIDFPLKVYQAPTMAEKRLWLARYKRAKRQFGEALQQREELELLRKADQERKEKERK